MCVYIYVYIHARPDTWVHLPLFTHACIKRRTKSRTHSQILGNFVGTRAHIYKTPCTLRYNRKYVIYFFFLNKIHAKNCILAQTR